MGTNWLKKKLRQWQYDLIGAGVTIFIILLLILDYDNQIFRNNFGSTNDKTMNFIMRLLDKEGGKPYVFVFFILVALFFGISAILRYRRDMRRK